MPVMRLKNTSPTSRTSNAVGKIPIIQVGELIGLFPYIYTQAVQVLGVVNRNAPAFSRQPVSPTTITTRIFNY